MQDRTIIKLNISLFTQHFGNPNNPGIVLIMGATAQGSMWEESFCQSLANKGYFVIRYDHRDTGKSSRLDYAIEPYLLSDLADDLLSIIQAYELEQVTLIGASMGSFLAQHIAINHPQKVARLMCIMSSPNHLVFVDGFLKRDINHQLPSAHPKIMEFYEHIITLQPKDSQEAEQLYRDAWLAITDDHYLMDTRLFEGKILRRLKNPRYIHNHSLALANSPALTEQLHLIEAPSIIIHGEEDYILPIKHGEELARMIPHSSLIKVPHMGHCFNKESFQIILELLS